MALPGGPVRDLLDLVAHVPCGAYEKVALALDGVPDEVRGAAGCTLDPGDGGTAPWFQFTQGRDPKVILHTAGDLARDLSACGQAAATDFALSRLSAAFGEGFGKRVRGAAVTGWGRNPLFQGGYSYCRVGGADARARMIAMDTGLVAFAGEAFSPSWQATAHGAYQSGRDVAARLVARL